MQIALIAQDDKKELMAQLCIAYCGILSKHRICATATTGRIVADATGMNVELLLSGEHGGIQQIANRIPYGEVDLLLYFRSTATDENYDAVAHNLTKLCDKYNIPLATNLATAEIMILALDRGDLDWRENYH